MNDAPWKSSPLPYSVLAGFDQAHAHGTEGLNAAVAAAVEAIEEDGRELGYGQILTILITNPELGLMAGTFAIMRLAELRMAGVDID